MSLDERDSALGLEGVDGLPPLTEALETLSHNVEWSPKDSIFKLIIMFFLPEMKKQLEVIRFQVSHMEKKDVQDVICHYAEEGKLIELAALLSIDSRSFFSSISLAFHVNVGDPKLSRMETLREQIVSMIMAYNEEERWILMGSSSSKLAQACKEKRRLMMSVMLLLEIYERIGLKIEYYLHEAHATWRGWPEQGLIMATYVARLLKISNFPITNELFHVFKHQACENFLDERRVKLSGTDYEYEFEQKNTSSMFVKIQSLPITKKQTTRMPLQQQRRSISTHSSQDKPGLFSVVQSFYTSPRYETSFSPKFCATTKAQTTFQVIEQHVPGLVLRKRLPSFLSAIKRVI